MQKLDESRTLSVCYSVKIGFRFVRIGDIRAVDGVSGRAGVFTNAPVLITSEIVGPYSVSDVVEDWAGAMLDRVEGHEAGEAFVEPQVVPPF